jgi:hypothetical protein
MPKWLSITLYVLIGMTLMYVVLKIMSRLPDKSSETAAAAKTLILSSQFYNLTKTNEFRELAKMPEFTILLSTLAEDQLSTISQQLV